MSKENLIGADASILNFVREADQQSCRLVISGRQISGLVSLSDLQQLPVRAALFAMVTQLEIVMSNAIRREFGASEGWLGRLSEERQSKIHDEVHEARSQDAFVDTLVFTQFSDKMTIIKKGLNFQRNKSAFSKELNRVRKLRDSLAHANDYAKTRDTAMKACDTVRLMDQWIEWLSNWPARSEE